MPLTLIHHRSSRLSRPTLMRAVNRGELLRLRRGIFVETWEWLTAKPWTRHLALAAAVGLQRPSVTFCRETALAIYGAPQLSVPTAIHLRAASTSQCGATPAASITGGAPAPVLAQLKAEAARSEDAYTSALRPWPVRRCLPPVPQLASAPESRKLYWSSESGPGGIRLPVPEVGLEDGSAVEVIAEPLPFALMDTLPRLSRQRSVVALDAAMAGRCGCGRRVSRNDLDAVDAWLWSHRARREWAWAVAFADPLSESPGESRSRVLIHQLGFAAPKLQTPIRLPGGSTARLDFDWDADRVAGEFDGRIKFEEARSLSGVPESSVYWNHIQREEQVRDTGRNVARWNWNDLSEPRRLELKLLREGVSRR